MVQIFVVKVVYFQIYSNENIKIKVNSFSYPCTTDPNVMDSLSLSNPDLSLTNLSLPNETETDLQSPSPSINPREKVNRTNNKFLQMIRDYFNYLKAALITILIAGLKASGPIPRHVAIIMDGNRRYAKKKGFSHVSEGHFEGAKTLEKVKTQLRESTHSYRL